MKIEYEQTKNSIRDKNVGLIVLKADEIIENEFRLNLINSEISLFHSRIHSEKEVTPDKLRQMEKNLPKAIALLPDKHKFDVIAYACTSGAVMIGQEKITKIVHSFFPEANVTTPIGALIKVLKTLKLSKIGFVSPYRKDVSEKMINDLEEKGLNVVAYGSFEESEEKAVARISPSSILAGILEVAKKSSCDCVFVSCTNLKAWEIIPLAEKKCGIPVISSNQVLAWDVLQLSATYTLPKNAGKIFTQTYF